jgi:hypothetical protein
VSCPDIVDIKILVDDSSKDQTARLAKQLGLTTFVHDANYGYGRNQQTCYREALAIGADIVVMVQPRLPVHTPAGSCNGWDDRQRRLRYGAGFANFGWWRAWREISCPTKYFEEASSINFKRSVQYGLGVLSTTLGFVAHKWRIHRSRLYQSTTTKPYYFAAPDRP